MCGIIGQGLQQGMLGQFHKVVPQQTRNGHQGCQHNSHIDHCVAVGHRFLWGVCSTFPAGEALISTDWTDLLGCSRDSLTPPAVADPRNLRCGGHVLLASCLPAICCKIPAKRSYMDGYYGSSDISRAHLQRRFGTFIKINIYR